MGILFVDRDTVWVATGRGRSAVCAVGDEMALAYDRSNGTAHKLGARAEVEAWAETLRGAIAAVSFGRTPLPGIGSPDDVAVVSFVANEDSVRAASECWERTGSALRFAEHFGQEDAPAPAGPRH